MHDSVSLSGSWAPPFLLVYVIFIYFMGNKQIIGRSIVRLISCHVSHFKTASAISMVLIILKDPFLYSNAHDYMNCVMV